MADRCAAAAVTYPGRDRCLDHAGHVEQNDVTMRVEPRIGSQLARADLKLQFHRRASGIVRDTALAYVGGPLSEGPYESKHSRPCGCDAAGRAMPFEVEDVRARAVDVRAGQCKSLVLLRPRCDVR